MDSFEKYRNKFGRFTLVLAFIFSVSGLIADDQKAEQQKAAEEMKKTLTTFIDSAKDKDNVPQHIKTVDTTPKAKGEAGEIESFIKVFLNKIASQRNNYMNELNTIGWGSLLSPERLKQDPDLEKSKIIVKKAKEAVERYRSQYFSLMNNIPGEAEKMNISAESKRGFIEGFEESMKESSASVKVILTLEAKIVDELGNIITLLASRKGKWSIADDQIVFEDDKDVEAFNSYLAKAQQLVAKQEALQRRNINSAKEKINKL